MIPSRVNVRGVFLRVDAMGLVGTEMPLLAQTNQILQISRTGEDHRTVHAENQTTLLMQCMGVGLRSGLFVDENQARQGYRHTHTVHDFEDEASEERHQQTQQVETGGGVAFAQPKQLHHHMTFHHTQHSSDDDSC